jgi:hypothetical protein
MKTVKEIVFEYIKNNGYDGLCYPDMRCGCTVEDDIPCGENFQDCIPGHKVHCNECNEQNNCDNYKECHSQHMWCIGVKKK